MAFMMKGDVRLDIGPGERKRIWAYSVNPAARVGVGLGISSVGVGVVNASTVGVNSGGMAEAVANAACPVNATTVGR